MQMNRRLLSSAILALATAAIPATFAQPAVSIVARAPTAPVAPGQPVSMAVSTSDSPVTYQWRLNGADIPGATAASYAMIAAGAVDAGSFHVVVTGNGGSTTVDLGTMTVMPTDARLINLSARGMAGTGSSVMIAGFVSRGDADSVEKNVLFRGMGPSLARMGGMMGGVLSNPALTIYDGQSHPMASNVGWMNPSTRATGIGASTARALFQPATMPMMNALAAFAPTAGSSDSALMMSAPPGAYTATLSGSNGSPGIALAECYDADAATGNADNTARLVNMSARCNVGAGDNALIAGFVIAPGPTGNSATVLVRAMGPGLAAMGVSGFLTNPSITLYDSDSKPIATNNGWANMPIMATGATASSVRAGIQPASLAVMNRVGAFAPMAGSADCALIATLPPGSYTAIVSGLADSSGQPMSGICLVEAYEVL